MSRTVHHTLQSQLTLAVTLIRREVQARYRGSMLGLGWSVITPLLMLGVYTFVFSLVFTARWPGAPVGHGGFALMLFAGVSVFMWFSDVVMRAPLLIVQQANYVKKVVFPLALLPPVSVAAGAVNAVIAFSLLLAAVTVMQGAQPTFLALPLVLLPFGLMLTGLAYALAAIGTYARDLAQVIGLVVTALQFLSPVFYPVSALPAWLQPWMRWNPVTIPIESVRWVVLKGMWPDWLALGLYTLGAAIVAGFGYGLFQRVRPGFADVL
jgi:lipopolysaccharide transport system permease protein